MLAPERGLMLHDQTLINNERFEGDEYPLQAARDCTQIIEMQRRSCELAKDVLGALSLDPTWSWNASENTSAHKRADYTAYEDDLSKSNTGTPSRTSPADDGSARNDMPQERRDATEESTPQERRQSDTVAEDLRDIPNMSATSSRRSSHEFRRSSYEDPRLRKLEKLIIAQKDEQMKKDAAAALAAETARLQEIKEYEMFQVKQKAQQETEAKAAVELALKTSAPMMFQDPIGRKFSCPWHLCHTWEVSSLPSFMPILALISVGNAGVYRKDRFRRSNCFTASEQRRVRSVERRPGRSAASLGNYGVSRVIGNNAR